MLHRPAWPGADRAIRAGLNVDTQARRLSVGGFSDGQPNQWPSCVRIGCRVLTACRARTRFPFAVTRELRLTAATGRWTLYE